MSSLTELPANLPPPEDDGAAAHLTGMVMPNLGFPATDGTRVFAASLRPRVVLYLYPKTGRPDTPLPTGWDHIPGARGCTPQACAFRDHHEELRRLGATVFGLSTQSTDYQREARERLHLPFPLLSDSELRLHDALRLPVFRVGDETLYKRLTLILDVGVITRVFYPVFPPDRHAADVTAWLRANPSTA